MICLRERSGDATVLVGARNSEKSNEPEEVQESRLAVAPQKHAERDARNRPLANASATTQNCLRFWGVRHTGIEAP